MGGSDGGGREGVTEGGGEEMRKVGSEGRTDGEKRQGGRDGGHPLLLPCRLSLAAQSNNEFYPFFHLKIDLTKVPGTTIAVGREGQGNNEEGAGRQAGREGGGGWEGVTEEGGREGGRDGGRRGGKEEGRERGTDGRREAARRQGRRTPFAIAVPLIACSTVQ